MSEAYYNEIDPYAAQWLRNLIEAGHIAPGVVDERSIEDVKPSELMGFRQCHFFAGVGVWSLALRRAGWPDNRPVWTGSCPCQPFSAAGKGAGFADERHLWPSFFHLVKQCRPAAIFGEQVASKAAEPWIDLVQADLEALGYAFGCVPFPSAGVGAPHVRDRTYWVGHTRGARSSAGVSEPTQRQEGDAEKLDDGGRGCAGPELGPSDLRAARVADTDCDRCDAWVAGNARGEEGARGEYGDLDDRRGVAARGRPGPTNGFWRDADWLSSRDGKWRPVEPGSFPLAHGITARVGRLRAYGNAINVEAAKAFIEAACQRSGAE